MTNEEKASYLVELWSEYGEISTWSAMSACEEMAEWKDAQFREYIEAHKQPVLASETDDTVVGYSIDVDRILEWLKSK